MNPLAEGRVDLRLTGDYYDDLEVETNSDEIVMTNRNEKHDSLSDKYGEHLGFNDETGSELAVKLGQNTIEYLSIEI